MFTVTFVCVTRCIRIGAANIFYYSFSTFFEPHTTSIYILQFTYYAYVTATTDINIKHEV